MVKTQKVGGWEPNINLDMDIKLQVLELDVWIPGDPWGRRKKKNYGGFDRYKNVHEREDFYDVYEEELEVVESKLKSLTIRINGYKDDEVGCDHDYPKPWCEWC